MTTLRPYIDNGPYIVIEEGDIFKSYGVCKLNLTNPYTDLNKITIKTNLKKKVKKFAKSPKIEVFYNNKQMKKIKNLGEGSHGAIYSFEYGKHNIALKIPDKCIDIDYEVEVIEKVLPKKVCRENIIPLKIVKDQNSNPFIIMQQANGDLRSISLLDNRLIFKIIHNVAKMLICFLKKGIIYLDLKRENILYKCWNNNISIFFGDLGGFFNLGDTIDGGGYFLSPEVIEKEEYLLKEEHMIYAFGCFIAELYGYRRDLGFRDGKEYTKEKIKNYYYPKFKEKILNDKRIPSSIKSLIFLFTELNPKKRRENDLNIVFEIIQ